MLPISAEFVPLEPDYSTSIMIKICRVLCIFFMIFVHVNPGLDSYNNLHEISLSLFTLKTLLSDILGRASVPALSLISGFLTVHSLQRYSYGNYVKERIKKILIPMATWNMIGIFFAFMVFLLIGRMNTLMFDINNLSLVDIVYGKVFALDYTAAYQSNNFLRDIVVCSILSPLIILVLQKFGWIAPVIVFIFATTLGYDPVVYRPSILFYYTLGLQIALTIGHFRWLHWGRYIIFFSCFLVLFIELFGQQFVLYESFKRAAISSAIILLSLYLSNSGLVKLLLKIEPHIYLIFLSHNFVFGLFWGGWQAIWGNSVSYPYTYFYLFSPFFLVLIIYFIRSGVARLPWVVRVPLTGR